VAKPIIEVKNLIKRYRKADKNAVDNITFDVEEGEFFTFLGPNGAGKTTTISILTTTLAKTSGTINIAGFDLDKDSSQVRSNVGIIFQNPSLDLNLTAEENVRFHTILYGLYPFRPTFAMMPPQYQKRIKDLAEVLGLNEDIYKPIKTFSGGMKRKLEIIRSIMHRPKVLFLDEPTIGLDPSSRKNLWEYLTKVRKQENMTIFLTTHYLDEAEDANRICIINKGKIVTLGTPDHIKKSLIEEYLILDAKDKNALQKELDKNKIRYQLDGSFKIDIKDVATAQKIIQSLKTPLTLLKTHSPTLEEAYLEIIEQPIPNENTATEATT
jgi:ABC-2 type transport system ATP-binding protein